jgi:hypothetical protein
MFAIFLLMQRRPNALLRMTKGNQGARAHHYFGLP